MHSLQPSLLYTMLVTETKQSNIVNSFMFNVTFDISIYVIQIL